MFRVICRLFFTLIFIYASIAFSVQAHNLNDLQYKHLLVLHSYDPSYPWTSDAQQGIQEAISQSEFKFRLSLEYLDAKRINNPAYLSSVRQYIKEKYLNYRFDAIIVTDDTALNLLNSLDLTNLKNLPTVAVGIGNPTAKLTSITNKGIILNTEIHLKENIKLIQKIRPNIRKLYLLSDDSASSIYIKNKLNNLLNQYPKIKLIEFHNHTLSDTISELKQISSKDAVLLGHYNTEIKNDVYYEYENIAHAIGEYSKAPVFVLWEFYVQHGIVGGYATRSYQLGTTAVNIITNQLSSLTIPAPTKIQTFRPIFDYQALKRHDIDINSLPAHSLIINKPTNIFERHQKKILYSSATVCVLLLFIISLLVVSLRRKKLLHEKNQEIVALQNKELLIQKNLLNVLGEAIESRSGETSNHVRRVAKVSSTLAQLNGLPQEQCDILEIISPMHDVGKIAIPEAILDKPGKLTDDEWQIMKKHTNYGYKLLNSGDGNILQHASIIALEHHEHWDGNGYPDGKSGKDIHLFARITAISDVFDALLSNRCYKKAWSTEEVRTFFEQKKGRQFDPDLTDLLLNNFSQFIDIRSQYPD
ncbi:ABC transporter substrate binding protein [Vibrio salinus]|uniref:ABC transporter substrate binding protein n=1 Tax=Vibrio salinus TaxID=2899784 RepID=UPI001E28D7C9|nr:ABC transporter substrate binding protein [Vibrio salinus]MCE0495901.1 HD domain-containing protein [Vibrio salinus]